MRSQTDWRTIRTAPRKGIGLETIPQSQIAPAIPAIAASDDIEVFTEGDGRIAGIKRGRVFHILWIDFSFTLYKH